MLERVDVFQLYIVALVISQRDEIGAELIVHGGTPPESLCSHYTAPCGKMQDKIRTT